MSPGGPLHATPGSGTVQSGIESRRTMTRDDGDPMRGSCARGTAIVACGPVAIASGRRVGLRSVWERMQRGRAPEFLSGRAPG